MIEEQQNNEKLMNEITKVTLDLSKRQLKKVPKQEDAQNVRILKLDENELQKIDNIDSYLKIETLSLCKNQLLRMYGICRLHCLRELNLAFNGILSIEGLKDCVHLRHLNLEGNNIKTIEHLNNNIKLEYLNLAENSIGSVSDISFLKCIKELYLHGNRLTHLRQCDKYLPTSLEVLTLAKNFINDLNEISTLANLCNLHSITISENPCVLMNAGADGFDYRPFVLNWCMSVKLIDGFAVDPIESLKAEWLYSQGRGRQFRLGEQPALSKYLSSVCPLIGKALENENERKLRLILSKAQQHQRQLQEEILESSHTSGGNSPLSGRKKPTSRIQSPRFSRLSARQGSPEAMISSYHGNTNSTNAANSTHMVQMTTSLIENIKNDSLVMTQSLDGSHLHSGSNNSNSINSKLNNPQESTPSRTNTPNPYNEQTFIATSTASPLAAASKMVPVPETLMSPDVCPALDAQRVTVSAAINAQMHNSKIAKNKDNKLNSPKLRSPQLKRNIKEHSPQTLSPRKTNNSNSSASSSSFTSSASVIQQHNAANMQKVAVATTNAQNALNNHQQPAQQQQHSKSRLIGSSVHVSSKLLDGMHCLSGSSAHGDSSDADDVDYAQRNNSNVDDNNDDNDEDDDSEHINVDKLKTIRNKAAQRCHQQKTQHDNLMHKNMNFDLDTESSAVVIQKIWRGYRTRKKTKYIAEKLLRMRTQEYIDQLTKDMEMTKAQLENERKIQQLQMQAISALWKKVSAMQGTSTEPNAAAAVATEDAKTATTTNDGHKTLCLDNNSTAVVHDLAKTCSVLTNQVQQLQGSMRDILNCLTIFCNLPQENVKKLLSAGVADALTERVEKCDSAATQTEIVAVHTPQIENQCNFPFMKMRPSTLPLERAAAAQKQAEQQTMQAYYNMTEETTTAVAEQCHAKTPIASESARNNLDEMASLSMTENLQQETN